MHLLCRRSLYYHKEDAHIITQKISVLPQTRCPYHHSEDLYVITNKTYMITQKMPIWSHITSPFYNKQHVHVITREISIWSQRRCLYDLKDPYTGWRRPVGCLKMQVIFRKRATNYRSLLREMTYKDESSYGSLPPCTGRHLNGSAHPCWSLL